MRKSKSSICPIPKFRFLIKKQSILVRLDYEWDFFVTHQETDTKTFIFRLLITSKIRPANKSVLKKWVDFKATQVTELAQFSSHLCRVDGSSCVNLSPSVHHIGVQNYARNTEFCQFCFKGSTECQFFYCIILSRSINSTAIR